MSDSELPTEDALKFSSTLPMVTVHWIPIDDLEARLNRTASSVLGAHLISYAYFFGPSSVPDDCRRLIYLDADLLVRRDLHELWTVDLATFPIAAIQDAGCPWIGTPTSGLPDYHLHEIDAASRYFNAGVLVIDVDEWRRADSHTRLLSYLKTATKTIYGDQDAMNAVFHDRWCPLHPTWNFLASRNFTDHLPVLLGSTAANEVAADPSIVHFAGRLKPWSTLGNPEGNLRFADEWLAIAGAGPYADRLNQSTYHDRVKATIGKSRLLRKAWYVRKELKRFQR